MSEGREDAVTRLWLIRHGEPDSIVRGRCYGSLDVGLSDSGRDQIGRVAVHLAEEPLAAIYASPRRRTEESAGIIAGRQSCRVDRVSELREIDFGDFEGCTYDDISRRYPELYREWMKAPTEVQFPNGESFEAMRHRVTHRIAALLVHHRGERFAVVTHGGAIRIVLAEALCLPTSQMFRLGQRFAAMNLIVYFGAYPVVELVNGAA